MLKINHNQLIAQFQDFRQKLYECFSRSSDACMDLLDALASNTVARSIAELSLSPLFPRTYNSVYKAIKESFDTQQPTANSEQKEQQQRDFLRVTAELVQPPQQRNFYLFVTDTTPNPRPHAKTLPERGYIYQPNTVKGNKPINIGNFYSIVSILPEKSHPNDAPWSIPLSGERVSVHHRGVDVASRQLEALMSDESLPWYNEFCVLVADTVYSQRSFLLDLDKHKNLVVIARVRSNRIFYQSPQLESLTIKRRGCPKKYGLRFDLSDPNTWSEASSTTQFQNTTRNGRQLTVTVQAWEQMLMRGSKKEKMYQHPFTLLRIHVTDDTNQSLWKPMWLIVIGQRREEISPLIAYQTYRQRYDIEHFNRFGKQRLLMSEFQTPEVKHEENWIRLVLLAYVQLFAAKDLAQYLPRPCSRYLKQNHDKIVAPSVVQRDFGRIISEVGKPGRSPKPRGNSPGRVTGQTQPKRSKQSVVKKGKKTNTPKEKAA
jgi:hypothetical protein